MKPHAVRTVLITGGAGFVGSNLAASILGTSRARVKVLDNLSRTGVSENVKWLKSLADEKRFEVIVGDVRNADLVNDVAADATEIYHFAAQVAVTNSVADPLEDFEVNARGTFNVLEAARRSQMNPFVFYTSTNKVYGALTSVRVRPAGERYCAQDPGFVGVNESQPLDFHSPYGCSKGTADQYVRDYARIYGLPTVVFRMSCIAGPRQFGTEDQGWVAHLLYSAIAGRPVTIYGDGLQVRDVLHVYDLVDAIHAVRKNLHVTRGKIYNLGGGMSRTFSVLEMLRAIERSTGAKVIKRFDKVRPGDQPLYISDTTRLEQDTGWRALRTLPEILDDIRTFALENQTRATAIRPVPLPAGAPARVLEGAA